MSKSYKFATLRYQHDPVTEEFVNIGIVIYSRKEKVLQAKCIDKYSRIKNMFERIDGAYFRRIARHIESKINELGDDLTGLFGDQIDNELEAILKKVLPPDDSSIQFSRISAGITNDIHSELTKIFNRHVSKYIEDQSTGRKTVSDVWKPFESALSEKKILDKLSSKKIAAPNLEYDFIHAAKNGIWHLCEPVTFDHQDEKTIINKAVNWVGRATSLQKSDERFKLNLLIGAPSESSMKDTFEKAMKILKDDLPVEHDLYEENEAEKFAESLKRVLESSSN